MREIVSERAIYNRERLFGLRVLPYIFSKLSILSILSLIQVIILIYLVNLYVPLELNLYRATLILFLISLSGLVVGLLISAISKSSAQALALVPTTLLPMVIFSGGMTPIKSMPDSGYIDAYRISMLIPTRWGLEELLREYDSYAMDLLVKELIR